MLTRTRTPLVLSLALSLSRSLALLALLLFSLSLSPSLALFPASSSVRLALLASLLVSSHLCSAAEIDHVVLLMMENRPFDFFFGHAGLPGADDLTKPQPGGTLEDYCNLYDTKDASKGKICPQKGKAYQVCRDGSSMSFHVYADDIFGPGVFNGASAP